MSSIKDKRESLIRDHKCGFCHERKANVCINCCDTTSSDILSKIDKNVERQRLFAVRFNELLKVLGNRMASGKAFEMYLVSEDF